MIPLHAHCRSAVFIAAMLLSLLLPAVGSCGSTPDKTVRVTNFHARILVQENGTLLVHETMRISTEGVIFERSRSPFLSGIYRTLISRIQGIDAYYHLKDFEMLGATLDGQPIPYSVMTSGRWFAKYALLGPERLFLSPGVHEFTLDYKTDRHITFLPDHDEFFWWVFGEGSHGWAASVGTVAVTVLLPEGSHGMIAELDDHSWNVGTGKVAGLLQRAAASGGTHVLHYGKILPGKTPWLSIVVSMPKGVVREPDLSMRIVFFFRDMVPYLPGLIGLTVFFAYYLIIWSRVGRDPEARAVVPRYRPPADCSPAVSRRLLTMGYDRTTFASALLDLAVKGMLRILRHGNGYMLEKSTADGSRMSPDEQVIYYALFEGRRGQAEAPLRRELDALLIDNAYRKHRRFLRSAVGRQFFQRNTFYILPGIIISLIVAAINAEIVDVGGGYVRELIGLGLWTVCAGLVSRFLSKKKVLGLKKPSKLVYLLLLFPAVFYSVAVALSHAVGVFDIRQFMFLAPLFIMMTGHALFLFLLRAPTLRGRQALDEIEGFRTYLAAAEGDRLDRMTPPEKTPALFQAYLPYALAFGVENRWSENFSGEIEETYTLPPLDVFLTALSRLLSGKR